MELAALEGIDWVVTGTDTVAPGRGRGGDAALRIMGRHHFTSALKRMGAVVRVTNGDQEELWGLVKVRPENSKPLKPST
jgi:magnesium-transporting ATPase (P-type)